MPRDTLLIFRHQLGFALRNRLGIAFGIAQPLLYLLLFGPLVQRFATWRQFVPGSLVQLCLMAAGLAGFGVVFDARFGVLERLRVTPASRLALLLGRVLTNTVVLLAQAVVLLLVGFALGLRAPIAGLLVALVLVVLVAVSLASLSYAVALTLRTQELFAPIVGTVLVPLLLLSGALIPMTAAPGWLNGLSRATPFRYVVEAMRAAFAGRYTSVTLLTGLAVALVLAVVSLAVGTRTFVRENA